MKSFAIIAAAGCGFRITLDLSAWGAVGVSLAKPTIRLQLWRAGSPPPPALLEFVTGAGNPVTFDPVSGLAVFAASAVAVAELSGLYQMAARAEYVGHEMPLFHGSIKFIPGVSTGALTSALPTSDTAYVAAQPFGPAPAPAPIAASVAAAQAAANQVLVRSVIMGS